MSYDREINWVAIVAIVTVFAVISSTVTLTIVTSEVASNPTLGALRASIALIRDLTNSPDQTTASAVAQIMPFLIIVSSVAIPTLDWIFRAHSAYDIARSAKDRLSRNSSQHDTTESNSPF
jgi:hypothetical protein